ncbi:hypothetical protein DES53_104122 [Roseimicrobium gellanilyticum]|uniref:Lipoprotein n=1 Tax=Roseimicrobium gellanilyticum TaxID=748857 RepID=A0A366HMJ3_9BACT|nr:hypothetical protein [Roseimicrobium gellanilyticum]RBP44303.1 hypothetical protein DES53_104122 [Roseimicrobium gellanilyticum]
MKRIFSLITLAAVALGLTSCFEAKSVVTVNKDGSATVEETTLLGAQLKAMLGGAGANDPGNPAAGLKEMVPDKAKAEERAKELGEGVTVKSHEEVTLPDGRGGVKVTYAVPDINKLKYSPLTSKNPESSKEPQRPMTFKFEGGTLTVISPDDKPKNPDAPKKPQIPKEQMAAQVAMMKPMVAGMRMTVELKGASGIASSDATHVNGDTVTFFDVEFDKLLEKPEVFGEMMESGDNLTQAEVAEKFKGVNGIKVEGKKTFKVVLK